MTLEEVKEILIKYEKEERKINDILNAQLVLRYFSQLVVLIKLYFQVY